MKAFLAVSLLVPLACYADEWNKHFAVSGTPELHIQSGNAALEVKSGSGSGVDVELRTRGYTISPSQVHVESHLEGNRLDLRIEVPEMHFDWGSHSVRVQVRVPANVVASIHSENGPIALNGLHGPVHLNAGNGPVNVQNLDGSFDGQTGNGPMRVEGRFDGLELRTGNGPVSVTANSGSKMASNWHVQTGNGPVSIRLPESISADLSLHTGNGPLAFNLPAEKHMVDKHDINAKLNGGGPQFSIRTGHGPVSIGQS